MKTALALTLAAALAASPSFAQTIPQANDSYYKAGQAELAQRLAAKPITGRARNVILFVGDGMGISTVTAARIYAGQAKGVDGESYSLALDQLPFTGLVKTYTHDTQVADSAPTATALLTGVKTGNGVIGVDQTVRDNDCAAAKKGPVKTLMEIAEEAGMATGVVTTTRITHATPAAAYAHTPNRNWEMDGQVSDEAKALGCSDIARQFIDWSYGDGFEVAFGGGRRFFTTTSQPDAEDGDSRGGRTDGADLIAAWKARHPGGAYVFDKKGFDAIDARTVRPVFGLFAPDHMAYDLDRAGDPGGEPTLAEMTEKAIGILTAKGGGYVLLVEGGKIDHGSHANNAARTLSEAKAFDEAVAKALSITSPRDTLIIVTADHSHGLTISGYPKRNNPILGLVIEPNGDKSVGTDEKPYTTLSFATGPGGVPGSREDLTNEDTKAPEFRQPALVPMGSSAHTGEDVEVKAIGPWAHLLGGTIEQNTIFQVMRHALGSRLKPKR